MAEIQTTPESSIPKETSYSKALYEASKYQERKQASRNWPHKVVRGLVEPVAVQLRAKRIANQIDTYHGEIGQEPFLTNEFVDSAARIFQRGEEKAAAQVNVRKATEAQKKLKEAAASAQNAEAQQLAELLAKQVRLLKENKGNIQEALTQAKDELVRLTETNPQLGSPEEMDDLAEGVVIIAQKMVQMGVQIGEDLRQKEDVFNAWVTGNLSEKQREQYQKLVSVSGHRLGWLGFNYGKNAGIFAAGAVGVALASNPVGWVGIGLLGAGGAVASRWHQLRYERVMREIDKARGILPPKNEYKGAAGQLQRIFSVDWESDPTTQKIQMVRAAAIGGVTSIAFRLLGSEGHQLVPHIADSLSKVFGNHPEGIPSKPTTINAFTSLAKGGNPTQPLEQTIPQTPADIGPIPSPSQPLGPVGPNLEQGAQDVLQSVSGFPGALADRLQDLQHGLSGAGNNPAEATQHFEQFSGATKELTIPGSTDQIKVPENWIFGDQGDKHILFDQQGNPVAIFTDQGGHVTYQYDHTFAINHGHLPETLQPLESVATRSNINIIEAGSYNSANWEWHTGLYQPGLFSHNELTMYVSGTGHNPSDMPADGWVRFGGKADGIDMPSHVDGVPPITDQALNSLHANPNDICAVVRLNDDKLIILPMDGNPPQVKLPPELFQNGQLYSVKSIATAVITQNGQIMHHDALSSLSGGNLPDGAHIVSLASDHFQSQGNIDVTSLHGTGHTFDFASKLPSLTSPSTTSGEDGTWLGERMEAIGDWITHHPWHIAAFVAEAYLNRVAFGHSRWSRIFKDNHPKTATLAAVGLGVGVTALINPGVGIAAVAGFGAGYIGDLIYRIRSRGGGGSGTTASPATAATPTATAGVVAPTTIAATSVVPVVPGTTSPAPVAPAAAAAPVVSAAATVSAPVAAPASVGTPVAPVVPGVPSLASAPIPQAVSGDRENELIQRGSNANEAYTRALQQMQDQEVKEELLAAEERVDSATPEEVEAAVDNFEALLQSNTIPSDVRDSGLARIAIFRELASQPEPSPQTLASSQPVSIPPQPRVPTPPIRNPEGLAQALRENIQPNEVFQITPQALAEYILKQQGSFTQGKQILESLQMSMENGTNQVLIGIGKAKGVTFSAALVVDRNGKIMLDPTREVKLKSKVPGAAGVARVFVNKFARDLDVHLRKIVDKMVLPAGVRVGRFGLTPDGNVSITFVPWFEH